MSWEPERSPGFEKGGFNFTHGYSSVGELAKLISQQRQQAQQAPLQAALGIGSAVGKIMKQNRSDKIAQMFLDKASETDPLAQTLNDSDLRPADAWDAYQKQRQYQSKIDLTDTQRLRQEAMIDKLTNPTPKPAQQTVPMTLEGNQYDVPLGQYLSHVANRHGAVAKPTTLDKALNPYGLTKDDLDQLDFETPNVVKFQDATGTQVGTDIADMQPKNTVATGSIGDKTFSIPYDKFKSIRQLYKNSTAAGLPSGNGADNPQAPSLMPQDDVKQAQAAMIREQYQAGKLSKEEARAQIQALGITGF